MSLRDRVLKAASAFQPKPVEVPELGGTLYVRPLTLGGLSRVRVGSAGDHVKGSVLMLIECLCDEKGDRLFRAEDFEKVAALPTELGERLAEIISDASAIGPKGVENAEGNS